MIIFGETLGVLLQNKTKSWLTINIFRFYIIKIEVTTDQSIVTPDDGKYIKK
jgi:hypothetical protein